MKQQVIEAMTADEWVVLGICFEGGIMAEIGRWEEPVEKLVKKGYLTADKFNHAITDAGRAAFSGEPVIDQMEVIGESKAEEI